MADDLLQYFEDTYIGRYRRNAPRHLPPLFAINLWNTFNRIDDELLRTNNSVEGWHRSFQGHVSACYPLFWNFLSVLQKEENMIRILIVQHLRDIQHQHQGNVIWIQAQEFLEYWTSIQIGKGFST